jgi:hypothetical protein
MRDGANVTDAMAGPVGAGRVVIVANCVLPPDDARISANWPWPLVLSDVLTEKLADVAPAGTITDAGTAATLGVDDVSVTAVFVPTADAIVTVPCADVPPMTELGLIVSVATAAPVGAGGVTMTDANCVTPPKAAEICTELELATFCAVTANVALVAPAEI